MALQQGEVVIYEHVDYQGKSLKLSSDTPNFVTLNFNDILSSVKVGPNTTVTLFRDVNYGGNTVVVDKDIPNIGAAFNDQASSLKIAVAAPALQPGEAVIYKDANYAGTSLKLTSDTPNFVTLNFNDILSSVKVGPNTVVTLYRDVDYGGNTVKVDKDVAYVGDAFNDQASSLKISLAPRTAIIYEHANYGGKSLVLTQDTPSFIPLNFNDILSSLKVGSEVTLFRDVNYQGPSVKITANTPFIGDVFNDQASSLKFT